MIDLNKYNQKVLAIIGTSVIVGFIVLIISGIVGLISTLDFEDEPTRDKGIVIDQNQIIDTTISTFSQNISILEPYQLDTALPIFLIPIGQKDQETKRDKVLTAGIGFESYSKEKDYYYSNFTGLFNNFVLIDYVRNIRIPIFSKKIALTEWAYLKIGDAKLILFKGTDTDINKDGLLNDDDFQSLFVFSVSDLKTKELRFENQTVNNFEPLRMTSKIYVRTGVDINGDKKFHEYKEPTDLYFFDVSTGEKETLVPENIKKQIQKILNK
jgi:hypothetical protein